MSRYTIYFLLLFSSLTFGSKFLSDLQFRQTKRIIEKFALAIPKSPQNLSKPLFLAKLPTNLALFEHEPKDIHDKSGYFFYYHSHRGGEHGHIHFFKKVKQGHHHLFAISFDRNKNPIQLFTTNAWVTDELSTSKEQVLKEINDVHFKEKNQKEMKSYLAALTKLFKPQIYELIEQKYIALERLKITNDQVEKDESIEILSQIPIDIAMQNEIVFN